MNSISLTLIQAYALFDSIRKPYPDEISIIATMFVSPERIRAFHDDSLYLSFLRTLIEERENVSFPEEETRLEQYFSDCLSLKEQMKQEWDTFPEQDWLSCIVRLLENLKTPYYPVYCQVLFRLESVFRDRSLFDHTLQSFYQLLIKSPEQTLPLIQEIAGHASVYSACDMDEALIAEILVHDLSLFACSRSHWTNRIAKLLHLDKKEDTLSLLRSFYKKIEEQYLQEIATKGISFQKEDNSSCASWLTARSLWMSDYAKNNTFSEISDSISYEQTRNLQKQSIDSTFLNTYAYNMNTRLYRTNPAIGREQELRDLELILISPKKSPILIGEAGVGKTSVVEGLSWHLQRGEVPKLLKNKKIFKLTTTALLSGTKYVGEMEDRIQQLMTELEKYPDIILFIDEIHTIVGAGSTESSNNDISNMLKPYIDRGDIKIIGATTSQEYQNYLLPDKALARRFYPISIEEPDEAMTLEILLGTIPAIEQETQVSNPFSEKETTELLQRLIRLSARGNQPEERQTRLPELPLTLLEMAFSYAALDSRKSLSIEDFILSVRHTNLLSREVRQKAESFFK